MFITRLAASLAAVALVPAITSAATLNIDFNGAQYSPTGPTYTGQGAFADPGNNTWNGLNGNTPSSSSLVYSNNTPATGVSVALTRGGFGGFSYNFGDEHHDLIQESVLVPGWSNDYAEVTVAGLSNTTPYTLYVYSQGFADDRKTTFTVGGVQQSTTGYANTSTTLDLGEDYLIFTGVTATSGNLVIRFQKAAGSQEANFSGFQLVAVPEPASLALLSLGGLLMARHRR